ncbi:MAG: hypothetical protein ACYDD1_01415 [Caulobacteraceae bacterium]
MIAIAVGAAAQAKTVEHHHKKVVTRHTVTKTVVREPSEMSELRNEVHALQARLDAQAAAQAETQGQVAAAQEQIQTAQAQDADASAAILQSIPVQVAAAVDAAKPKTDKLYYKGVSITLGGFLEAASIYRSRNLAADIASGFQNIPFASTKTGHDSELKLSEHQSRLSALVQGNVNKDTVLSMYGEFDLQGGPQTANYNESNSWTPRVRHLYGTVDLNDSGWHFLAGQTWSLATMNSKGITPRNEITPPQIDAQYIPGFIWARQSQFRVTKEFLDHSLWIAVSAENAQTTFTGTVPANVTSLIANASGIYSGPSGSTAPAAAGGGTAATATTATQSLNHLPDVVVKVAYELPLYGRSIHLEAFGIGRAFTDQIGTSENTVYGGGIGGGFLLPVLPGLFDVQGSGISGKGIGRYGSAQLSDVTFRSDGRIEPITETAILFGGTVHATPMLDIYAFGGEEIQDRQTYGAYGYGSYTASNAGCLTEGGTCGAQTHLIEQLTAGFWQKIYQGPFGRAQVGVQYSYTQRDAFAGVSNIAPKANDSMVFTSFRYYPF